jgi:hypothetical protein
MTNDFTFVWIGDPHLEASHEEAVKNCRKDSNGRCLKDSKGQIVSSTRWLIDKGQPNNWINQTNWIVKNINTYNIQAVLCAGDMYMCFDPNCRPEMEKRVWEWDDGKGEGLVAIDHWKLPYLVAAGNHDWDCTDIHAHTDSRITTSFDKYVGHDKICTKPWYVECCQVPVRPLDISCPPSLVEGSKANQAIRFDVRGRHVLVIALEIFPRPDVLRWARNLAKKYHDHEVIIITHAYMTDAGDLFGGYTARGYWGLSEEHSSSGVDILNCIKKLPNVKAILCGHSNHSPNPGGEAHRTDVADDGHPLLGIYSDYQLFTPNSHVLLLLQVSGSEVKVRVFDTNADQEVHYSFDFPTNAEGTSPTNAEGTRFDYPDIYPYILPWGHWAYRGPSLCGTSMYLYAAWKGAPGGDRVPGDDRLWYSSFDDHLWYASFNGTDWSGRSAIHPDANSANGPALSAADGVHDDLAVPMVAAWNDREQRLWYSTIDRSIGKKAFQPPQCIPGAASTVGPSLAWFKGKLYAAWKGAYSDTNDQRLWYESFDGENWSPQRRSPRSRQDISRSAAPAPRWPSSKVSSTPRGKAPTLTLMTKGSGTHRSTVRIGPRRRKSRGMMQNLDLIIPL